MLLRNLVSAAIALLLASAANAQQITIRPGDGDADFRTRVESYADLRRQLEQGLSVRVVTDDVTEIKTAVRTLSTRIRAARASAREGDLFTPAMSAAVRQTLRDRVQAHTCAAIMDDNPGEFPHHVNEDYPEAMPVSTVPPNVLAALPALPDDLQYRFVGHHLILLDARSGVIVDEIRNAIPCAP